MNSIVSSNFDIASHNNGVGKNPSAHMSEAVIQNIIVSNLRRRLPTDCFDNIISENKSVGVNNLIPDIIIRKPAGNDIFAIFELKTLFSEDNLTNQNVRKDLNKLCQYKSTHNGALCCFILAAEKNKASTSGQDILAPLAIVPSAFTSPKNRPTKIGDNFYAIPWMSSQAELGVEIYLWRVCHKDNLEDNVSGKYKFNISF
ncbi:hypothetical protein AAE485_01530 [Acidithiobacillus ferriphilus]|uniref:hypothetical protein n=1 Tax=Acidithiobacillus ferriphilus TaxID=1689834 RepID=UPI00390C865C